MTLVRSIFLALAVMLPTAWTVAQAADAPAADAPAGEKKEKKAKKGAEEGRGREEGGRQGRQVVLFVVARSFGLRRSS